MWCGMKANISFAVLFSVMMLSCVLIPVSSSSVNDAHLNQEPICQANRNETWTVGLLYCNDSIDEGYTLFSPMPSSTSYLIDSEGREIHSWESPGGHRPGLSSYLLPDGDLLRTANIAQQAVGGFSGGGTAGKIERIGWDGTAEWSWEYSSTTFITHHDIEPMPNGNILAIAWEDKTEAEATQAGRNPAIASDSPGGTGNVWPDHIIEIEPLSNNQANIVWEWHAWDHLIQDYDSTKDNFGVVNDHPELLDINFIGATGNQAGRADWMHCNGIDYNELLDQIALSCKNTNEIYILDHSTTTQEAASHTGGDYGKGGDFLYRWGNPQAYDAGLSSDQFLFGQHDVQWIEEGRVGAGNLLVFNNGNGRNPSYSSIEVIQTPGQNGVYPLNESGMWGPASSNWTWNLAEDMYAPSVSGAERLSNGNTLVTIGTQGTFYEVNLSGEIVWKYINPISKQGTVSQGDAIPEGNNAGTLANTVFKARRYSAEHPAFSAKNLTPGDYLEPWTDNCPSQESLPWDADGDGCIDDTDSDGILDPNDSCPGFDDKTDVDNDSVPDGCDVFIDSDGDGVEDSLDTCPGFDDGKDIDNDSVPDDCDVLLDNDGDGISNTLDKCEGFDDAIDVDNDSAPDDCDTLVDNDGDGVSNLEDSCEGHDDSIDLDEDGIPDGCDTSPNSVSQNQNHSEDTENVTQTPVHQTNDTAILQDDSEDSTLQEDAKNSTQASVLSFRTTLSLLLIFLGVWLLLYILSSQISGEQREKNNEHLDLVFASSSSDAFEQKIRGVLPMIDLPSPPLVQHPQQPTDTQTPYPSIPDEGLPEGWSEEQWKYYGQQWIDARKN